MAAIACECAGLIAGTEPIDRDVFCAAPQLKVVSRIGVGLDNVDLAAADEFGVVVRTTPDAPIQAVAELTLGLILALLRQIPFVDRDMRQGKWAPPIGRLLSGQTVGVIGLGRIGQGLVRLLAPFEVEGPSLIGGRPLRGRRRGAGLFEVGPDEPDEVGQE